MRIDVKTDANGIRYIRPYLGTDKATGRPIRPYKRFPDADTDEAALEEAQDWLATVIPAGEIGASPSLESMLRARLRTLSVMGMAPKTIETYESALRCHIAPTLGRKPYYEVKPYEVTSLYAQMAESGLGTASILSVHCLLSGAYKSWTADGLIQSNPMLSVQKPSPSGRKARALDEGEFRRLNEVVVEGLRGMEDDESDPESVVTAMGVFIIERTGMRAGEACALWWRDFRPVWMDFMVGHTLSETRKGVVRKGPKSKKSNRAIALDDSVSAIVMRYRSWQRSLLESKGIYTSPSTPIISATGEYMRPSSLSRRFRAVCEEAHLPRDVHLHTLRHTYATYQIYSGAGLPDIQAILGHASLSTTTDIYSHLLPGAAEATARSFGATADRINKGGNFGQQE